MNLITIVILAVLAALSALALARLRKKGGCDCAGGESGACAGCPSHGSCGQKARH